MIKPDDPFPTKHGAVLVVHYVHYGRTLRPHSIVTEDGEWDANWCRARGHLLVHYAGSGLRDRQYLVDRHHTYWIAGCVTLTGYQGHKEIPVTTRGLAQMKVTRLKRILGDPFTNSSEVDGHIRMCGICNDYFDDDEHAPCPHLRWSDDACEMVGPGACDGHDFLPASVAKVCEHLGPELSALWRARLSAKRYSMPDELASALEINDEPKAYGGDGCEPALIWAGLLGGGKAFASARALMVDWISAALEKRAA